ncbi:MAG: serine/threonine protein kinase [Deltaproteobacteria bacterium]|nr:serine/threonine protein kinase [Deltaproteobacteria bacterium]
MVEIGSTIDGKYRVDRLLGQGGMGSVYEAVHMGTGRRCAVKVISEQKLVSNPQVVSRFQREARAAGALESQYIAQVLDAGVDRDCGLPFLAMEYLDGEGLNQMFKRLGALPADLVLRVAAQACLGLQRAHEANVVHRDIKPHNLFLARRESGEVVVKLLDFGIAKVKMDQSNETSSAELTKEGSLLGSPLYVSPEQARGKKEIDRRTDIWSLGAVLYQALSGRTPYAHAAALGDLILMVCTEEPPPIQEHAPWVAPEVAAVVHRCLQQNPDARYQSAAEILEAVRQLLPDGWTIQQQMCVSLEESERQKAAPRLSASSPAAAGATGLDASAVASQSGAGSTTGPITRTQVTARGRAPSARLVTAGALVVVAMAGVGVVALGRKSPARPAAEPTAAAAASAARVAAPSATASIAVPASDAKPKRVYVVVLPKEASVQVEGKDAPLRDGVLDLEGLPGSVHRVRVVKGTFETVQDVVITESGALPPMIQLKLPGVAPVPLPGKGPAASATGAATAAPPVPKGIDVSTEEFNK